MTCLFLDIYHPWNGLSSVVQKRFIFLVLTKEEKEPCGCIIEMGWIAKALAFQVSLDKQTEVQMFIWPSWVCKTGPEIPWKNNPPESSWTHMQWSSVLYFHHTGLEQICNLNQHSIGENFHKPNPTEKIAETHMNQNQAGRLALSYLEIL